MKNKSLLFVAVIIVSCVSLSFFLKSRAQKRQERKALTSALPPAPAPAPNSQKTAPRKLSEPGKPAETWVETDPKVKMEWAWKQEGSEQQNITLGIMSSWVESNPQEAVQYARDHALEGIAGVVITGAVANYLATTDPVGAKAFAENLPTEGGVRDTAIIDAAMKLAYDDPAGTAVWVARVLPDSQSAFEAVLKQYAVQDPEGAMRWIDTLPVESRDLALGAYAINVQGRANAIMSAARINDEEVRTRLVTLLAQRWMSSDAAEFRQWVVTSGLPPATQSILMNLSPNH